jgi:hypothetical protein
MSDVGGEAKVCMSFKAVSGTQKNFVTEEVSS